MNPPRWRSRYSDDVRAELMHRVEAGSQAGSAARRPEVRRRDRVRLVVAVVIALAVVVPASAYAFGLGAGHRDRAAGPTAISSPGPSSSGSTQSVGPSSAAPGPSSGTVGAGCAATSAVMPAGAFHATIADVDGDGRRDTEWATISSGNLRFGITTASGATASGEQGFAGGGSRSFVVGRLGNGVVVAITSEDRDSPVYTFSDCRFHALRGEDLLSGSTTDSPFTLYSEEDAGTGGCYDGRLALVHLEAMPGDSTGDREQAVARWIDVSADGLRATLTDETATIATDLDHRTDPAEYDHYGGISCGDSTVLFPVVRG